MTTMLIVQCINYAYNVYVPLILLFHFKLYSLYNIVFFLVFINLNHQYLLNSISWINSLLKTPSLFRASDKLLMYTYAIDFFCR